MARAETAARPRGTKPVSQAFFTALESIPEAQRAAVGKSALAMIRDEMKSRRDKEKAAAAKAKAAAKKTKTREPAPAKAAPKTAAPEKSASKTKASAPANGTKPVGKRGRKADTTASEA
jgi:hypothetical protein